MNLSDIATRVRFLTGVASTDIVSDADVTTFINEAYVYAEDFTNWSERNYQFFVQTEEGVSDYAINKIDQIGTGPGTYITEVSGYAVRVLAAWIVDGDGRRLELLPADGPAASSDDPLLGAPSVIDGNPATPQMYRYNAYNNNLTLYPTPDSEYTLYVHAVWSVKPLDSGDSPILDPNYHHAIAYGAAAALLEAQADGTGRGAAFQARCDTTLDALRRARASSGTYFQLGGRRSSNSGKGQRWGRG